MPSIGGPISAAFGLLFHVLAWICLAVICGLILFLIVKAIRDYEGRSRSDETAETGWAGDSEQEERAPGELPADVYLSRAKELAQAGRFRDAIAQLLLGAMSYIERGRLIRYRRGLTHRDYIRAVSGKEPMREALSGMVHVYEPIGFGRRSATPEHFQLSLEGYEAGFRALPGSQAGETDG